MDDNTKKKAQLLKAEKEVKELLITSRLARKSDQALFIMPFPHPFFFDSI